MADSVASAGAPLIRMHKLLAFGFVTLLVVAGLAVLPTAGAVPPTIQSPVSPASGSTNGGTEVTISGTNFVDGALVEVGSSFGSAFGTSAIRAHVTAWGPSGLTVIMPASPLPGHAAGSVGFRVTNPDGQSATFTGLFDYVLAGQPKITSISPTSGPSSGGQTVDITGTGFGIGPQPPEVTFDGKLAVILQRTATKITVEAPGSVLGGTADVIVKNPDTQVSATSDCHDCYAWTPAADPVLTGTSPSQGSVNGGTLLTLSGSKFAPGALVYFDASGDSNCASGHLGSAAAVSFNNAGQLVAVTPSVVKLGALGTVNTNTNVCVVNPDGRANADPFVFTFIAPTSSNLPTIGSIAPTSGPVYGGSIVTLTGTNFHTGSNEKPTVAIDTDGDCTTFTAAATGPDQVLVLSSTSIQLRMPATTGSAAFQVTNPDGASVCFDDTPFVYTVPLEITDLDIKTGPSVGGTTSTPVTGVIKISGVGFDVADSAHFPRVFFGNVEGAVCTANNFVYDVSVPGCIKSTSTAVYAVPPPQPVPSGGGGVFIVVSNRDGHSASFWKYTYTTSTAPVIDDVQINDSDTAVTDSNGGDELTIKSPSGTKTFVIGVDPDGTTGDLEAQMPTVTLGGLPAEVLTTAPGIYEIIHVIIPPRTTAASAIDTKVVNPDGQSDQSNKAAERFDQSLAAAPAPVGIVAGATRGPTTGGTIVLISGDPDTDGPVPPPVGDSGASSNFFGVGKLHPEKPTVKVGGIAVPEDSVVLVPNGGSAFGLTCSGASMGACLAVVIPPRSGGAGVADQVFQVTNPDGQTGSTDGAHGFDYDYSSDTGLQPTPAPVFVDLFTPKGPSNGGTVVHLQAKNMVRATLDGGNHGCGTFSGDAICAASFNGDDVVTPVPIVLFDNVAGTETRVIGPTGADDHYDIYVRAPPHAPTLPLGVPVVIKNPDSQQVTASKTFIYDDAASADYRGSGAPTLTAPTTKYSSFLGGDVLTLTGTNFPTRTAASDHTLDAANNKCGVDAAFDDEQVVTPRPIIRFGDVDATEVCVLSSTSLTVRVPPHAPGLVSINLLNPDGDAVSLGGAFRYLPVVDVPTGLSLSSAPQNGGRPATLSGFNFAAGTQVYVVTTDTGAAGGNAATMGPISPNSLSFLVPAASGTGAADVKAVDLYGQTGTLDSPMTYLTAVPPQATAIFPTLGSVNGGTTVTVTGAGFASGAVVRFDNAVDDASDVDLIKAVSVSPDGKTLSFVAPNFVKTTNHDFGPIDVLICNPVAGTTLSAADATKCSTANPHAFLIPDAFGYTGTAGPTVAGIDPTKGPIAGGTAVTITGTGFVSGATVKFGDVAATNVVVVDSSKITATTPAHDAGAVSVTVLVNSQAASLATGFTFEAPLVSTTTTTTSGTTTTTSHSGTTTTGGSTTGTTTTGLPGVITADQILKANKAVTVTVTREGSSNVIKFVLPPASQRPGTVLGVQIWAHNSPYSLVETISSTDPAFKAGSYTHTGATAKADTKYLVTMFYGPTEALGRFTSSSAPDDKTYPGTASTAATKEKVLPTWAIVLIVLGILFLVVLVAILIARGRQPPRQGSQTQQAYIVPDQPQSKAEPDWQEKGGEVHQARCPACATSFTATGQKPIVTVCPGCGKKGILR